MSMPSNAPPEGRSMKDAGPAEALAAPVVIRIGRRAERFMDGPLRPAVFTDRDGVVMADSGYPSSPSDVAVFPEAAVAIARLNAMDVPVVLVSNQSGVGRGYFGWPVAMAVDDELARRLAGAGASIDLSLYAGEAPDTAGRRSLYRKPAPGLLNLAARLFRLDLGRSVMIGDRRSDLEAAFRAGVATGILIREGGCEWEGESCDAPVVRAPNAAAGFGAALEHVTRILQRSGLD
jgi:D-glycero-D-manno-heptose 1,7-bisphosphate phosphatase